MKFVTAPGAAITVSSAAVSAPAAAQEAAQADAAPADRQRIGDNGFRLSFSRTLADRQQPSFSKGQDGSGSNAGGTGLVSRTASF
ncbi:hypothetical protein Q9Q95_14860 [Sphingomonas sp. DG1-23]|uniref:hypothetical protein n=1 Tax=Sphingomonas sp. DG1-23 TaxID=3068316 RepID=UPI00273E8101|nr:hypothetical protein [Sphingomonas sp. DG1-23]MDP5280207.1 hypothetical protein [Sphingomonas sp. DG1-23]